MDDEPQAGENQDTAEESLDAFAAAAVTEEALRDSVPADVAVEPEPEPVPTAAPSDLTRRTTKGGALWREDAG